MKPSLMNAAVLFLIAAILIGGCAKKQVILEPEIPVFRYEQYVHNEGFRGKFASETHDTVMVTPDRKKTDSTFKWTGAILGKLTKEKHTAEIVRLDKDLIWQIDLNKMSYLERPIQKVVLNSTMAETVYVEECEKCTVKTGIKRTGAKKVVNGYDAEQVILTLTSNCAGKADNESAGNTTLTLEVWLAPGVVTGSELEAFDTAYAKKVGMDNQMVQAVGDALLKAFPSVKQLALMMKDLRGYPILNILSVENDQYLKKAEEERKRKAGEETKEGGSSPTDMLTGFLSNKFKENQEEKQKQENVKWGNVIWRVSWESRNFQKTSLTASEFNLEEGLKKIEQKESPEGEQGGGVVGIKPGHLVKTACMSTLTEAQLGAPIYPGAKVARSRPYDESHHNTKWHYTDKKDYRVQFATADPMNKVVAFYEKQFKTKCPTQTRTDGGLNYKIASCTQPAGPGLIRTFMISDQPIEITADLDISSIDVSEESHQTMLGFELSVGKSK